MTDHSQSALERWWLATATARSETLTELTAAWETLAERTTLTPAEVLFERHRAPKPVEGPDYQSNFRYAYHLDAQLFAEFLREYARARGVAFIPDDVQDVSLDERGFVASLKLAQRGDFPVEFVVDCLCGVRPKFALRRGPAKTKKDCPVFEA